VVFKKIMQRALKILTWMGITAWFVVILGFVSGEGDEVLCNRIEVVISDTIHLRFVTESDIRALFRSGGMELQGYPISGINIREMEGILEESSYIRDAEVSTDITGKMEVRIEQRVPLVRIMPQGSGGYYLDTEGKTMPLSNQFTPHIMLVSGYVGGRDTEAEELEEIHRFCSHVSGDPFWSDQIVQIYRNRKGEYELIPRVGAHQILLGSMNMWEKKLRNLEMLYDQGFPSYGWNTYGVINLKYTNQVICTKR
jgi:cell division protein FtsQ